MTKLNQIIALSAGKKSRANATFTGLYHRLQRKELLNGLTRTYHPLKEDDTDLMPPESKKVQFTVSDAIREAQTSLVDLFNIVATQDESNCNAKADIKVNGSLIAAAVPVTTLLFLEKQLVDLHTFVSALPTLDPAYEWHWDEATACYRTNPMESNRTKRVYLNHVKCPATDKFPAQVEVYQDDVTIGRYVRTDFSGAIPATQRNEMLDRVSKLQEAVKSAREEANSSPAIDLKIGQPILSYIFGAK